MRCSIGAAERFLCFSALQRAEIAEIARFNLASHRRLPGFSALQRAEIAEIKTLTETALAVLRVSVLFNEPKLLKSYRSPKAFCAA